MGGQGQRRILVVDDDFFISDLLLEHLTEQGFAVDVAINARVMGRHLELHPPDLIILDIMLPGMDGTEIGHLLRVNPATAQIPILVISADRRIARKAESVHANGWIAKPFDLADVVNKIESILARET